MPLTGDYNPLHFDKAFVSRTKFGRLVAQGGLTTGILHALVAMDMPGPGTVFLSQNWKFTAPVYIGDTITAEATVLSAPIKASDAAWNHSDTTRRRASARGRGVVLYFRRGRVDTSRLERRMKSRGWLIATVALGFLAQRTLAQEPGRRWQLGRLLVSVGSETDASSQFARVVNVLLLPDSGIVVANGGSMQLRFFDAAGKFLRQSGREGAGPGEYRFFDRVFRLAGDSLGVYDGTMRRLTVLNPTGMFARTVTLVRPPGVTGVGGPTPVGGFADGTFASFVAPAPVPGAGQERGALHRLTATWFRHGANGEFISTLGESPGGERFLELSNGMVVNWAVPFQRVLRMAVSADRVFAGDGSEAGVVALHRDRAGSSTIRLDPGTLTLTNVEVAAYRQEQLDRAPSPAYRTRLETSFSKTPAPTSMPAFADLRVDADGNVWVQEYRRPGAAAIRWRVVAPEGAIIASFQVPSRFAITDIRRDRVAGIWLDENDVETVRVYQLRR